MWLWRHLRPGPLLQLELYTNSRVPVQVGVVWVWLMIYGTIQMQLYGWRWNVSWLPCDWITGHFWKTIYTSPSYILSSVFLYIVRMSLSSLTATLLSIRYTFLHDISLSHRLPLHFMSLSYLSSSPSYIALVWPAVTTCAKRSTTLSCAGSQQNVVWGPHASILFYWLYYITICMVIEQLHHDTCF